MSKKDSTCFFCGIDFVYESCDSSGKYCSRTCWSNGLKAEANRPAYSNGDGTATITITHGLTVIIDESDLPLVSPYTWMLKSKAQWDRYACTKIKNKRITLHRFLMSPELSQHVDHINGDTLDNRRSNLRLCTNTDNARNARLRHDSTTGFKGVSKAGGRWVAQIRRNGTTWHIGSYQTPEDAARSYDAQAKILFGEFAWLNFPD